MEQYAKPPRTGSQPCKACGRKMHHPIWRRVDHDEYEILCDICGYAADTQFTPDAAEHQARLIVHFACLELEQRARAR